MLHARSVLATLALISVVAVSVTACTSPIDPGRCYRYALPSGRAIDLFFYDGGVSQAVAFERLLASFFTVWIKASPGEHMSRVRKQGDLRPMGADKAAMSELICGAPGDVTPLKLDNLERLFETQ